MHRQLRKSIQEKSHNHNDFGMAVDNSMMAVFDGPCRQIECSINGVGERAGNASLEQCVMLINHFGKIRNKNITTNIKTKKLQKVSDFVSEKMLPRQPHYPITGDNSAKHTSGGHTNAILKNPLVYQPFDPKETGKKITFVFSPLSGGNHAQAVIKEFGYKCEDKEKTSIAPFIKEFYKERRKGITDKELMYAYFMYRSPMHIETFDYSRSASSSTVFIHGTFFGKKGKIKNTHKGKDSALAALKSLIDKKMPGYTIDNYKSKSTGSSINAKSESCIKISDKKNNTFEGIGLDGDIEISAMKALIDGYNKAFVESRFKK